MTPSRKALIRAGFTLFCIAVATPCASRAQSPVWWTRYYVLNSEAPDDFACVNEGQLKYMAASAAHAFAALGLTGRFSSMVGTWKPNARTDDYALVNLGQVKAVAAPFFDSLAAAHYLPDATRYPWTNSGTPADDYAPTNIGQVKYLFSFAVLTPSAPVNLAAKANSKGRVSVTWTNVSVTRTSVYIEASSDNGTTWTRLGWVPAAAAAYRIPTTVTRQKSLLYRVFAIVGPSPPAYSAPVHVAP